MSFASSIIIKTALQTIEIEAQTIAKLKNSINLSFEVAVQKMYECKGRIVVTGIGKSALVGKKIVATLNSTGTPALFMHAADAIHGDLGMIRQEDIILCISKSGETSEIKVLVPMLRILGGSLIAMVSNLDSYLAKQADYIFHTPVAKEADPNNLAPTASTTAQMVMGDAIAMALLALNGFTPNDFAQFHPGGLLGKRLYMRVCDIVTHHEKPAVQLTDPIRATIVEITSKRLGCTAVLDEQQQVQGIITDGDLRRMLEQNQDTTTVCAKDIMSSNPKTISSDALCVSALEKMKHHSITQLIVLEQNTYVGIIHLHDLIREGII